MIQSSIPNPCSDIFQDDPIVVKSQHSVISFISNINKNKLGIYYHYYRKGLFDRSKGQLRLFEYKREKWVEYYNMENSHNGHIRLLCFADNDNQLLFHKQGEYCIKGLIVNQNKLFGFITYQSSTIQIFINFPCYPYEMIVSKDQKFILIYDFQKYCSLDVSQKTITFTISGDNAVINFFDNNYFVLNLKTESGKNPLSLLIHMFQTLFYEAEIQQLIYKSLGFFCYKKFVNYTILVLNMQNLKFIRKIKLNWGQRIFKILEAILNNTLCIDFLVTIEFGLFHLLEQTTAKSAKQREASKRRIQFKIQTNIRQFFQRIL